MGDRRRMVSGLTALAAAVAAGVLVAVAPGWMWPVLLLLMMGAAVLVAPAWTLLGASVGAGAATALVMTIAPGALGVVGHGRTQTLLAGLGLLYVLSRRFELRIPRPTVIVAGAYAGAVVLTALVALFNSRPPSTVLSDVNRELSLSLAPLIVALVACSNRSSLGRAFRGMGLAVLIPAASAVLYTGWSTGVFTAIPGGVESVFARVQADGGPRTLSYERVVFPFADTDPNSAAAIFAMLAAFCVGPLFASTRLFDRQLGVLVAVASVGAVLATQSRMGVLMVVVIAATYAMLSGLSGRARAAFAAAALASGLAAVVVVTLVFPQDRQITLNDDNVQARFTVFAQAIDDIASSPIYGHGLRFGQLPRYYENLQVHNEYLQRLVDGGVIGGSTFFAVLGTTAAMAIAVRKQRGVQTAIGTAVLATLGALMISMGIVASWSGSPFVMVVSWLLFGVISALYISPDEQAQRREPEPG